MNLRIRATVASAAHDIVPSWPLDSFIAVNPLRSAQSAPFDLANTDALLTRSRTSYLRDFKSGRIRPGDLEAAVAQRIPELAGDIEIGGVTGSRSVPAARVAALELQLDCGDGAMDDGDASTGARNARPDLVDDISAAWIAAFLTPDPLWPMPHRALGLFASWRVMARWDARIPRRARRRLRQLPERSDTALAEALQQLGVTDADAQEVLRCELEHLPGWVSHIAWRAEKVGDIELTGWLALRMTLRAALGMPLASSSTPRSAAPGSSASGSDLWPRANRLAAHLAGGNAADGDVAAVARVLAAHPTRDHRHTWQSAFELNYRERLLTSLRSQPQSTERPDVQLVMCIDARSEGLRRHLEVSPGIETFGFAGFFGVPMRFARYGARGSIDSLPALLSPKHSVSEAPVDDTRAKRHEAAQRRRDSLSHAIHSADSGTASPFAFAESAGWFYGISSALRTFAPAVAARLQKAVTPTPPASCVTVADAFTLEERASLAENAVRMMGMNRLAPLVVVAGHGSESANNLYEATLDCGACGGNPGGASARAASAIFNDPEVRRVLATRGIDIPEDTFFLAAEHNTATDSVELLDLHLLPQTHRTAAEVFTRDLKVAAELLLVERAVELPGASPNRTTDSMRRRAYDWAEVYPELGLAGNAAMIVGPRELTRGVNLDRRVFLHSYRPELDPDSSALETILTAPVVVAQWINHQYYFSTLDPENYGAGTKTIHNAIGTLGVLSGQSGDLRRGLPWQSVGVGVQAFYEPMRLAVVVQAPLDAIGVIISRNQVLRELFDNDWISLTARQSAEHDWQRYTRLGWTAAAPAPAPAPAPAEPVPSETRMQGATL